MSDTVKVIGLLLVLSGIAWASNQDYEAEQQADKEYCEMVKSHAWQDYKAFYKERCE